MVLNMVQAKKPYFGEVALSSLADRIATSLAAVGGSTGLQCLRESVGEYC